MTITTSTDTDRLNGDTINHVLVSDGELVAYHSSYPRGGCLYAGFVTLRNTTTGAAKEIDITSFASGTDTHAAYLIGLARKHVG